MIRKILCKLGFHSVEKYHQGLTYGYFTCVICKKEYLDF